MTTTTISLPARFVPFKSEDDGFRFVEPHQGLIITKRGTVASMPVQSTGYVQIFIATKKYLLHRVIWEAVNGPIPEGHHVHHKNGNKLDNRIENLELVTAKEHALIAARAGLLRGGLSDEKVSMIRDELEKGRGKTPVKEYFKALGEKFDTKPRNIKAIFYKERRFA